MREAGKVHVRKMHCVQEGEVVSEWESARGGTHKSETKQENEREVQEAKGA